MDLKISDELAGTIHDEAQARGKSVEEFLRSAILRERSISDREKIEKEQEWWTNLSLTVRVKYEGQYVAIHNKEIVDHDDNEVKLYARIRGKYGKIPVLIMPAEGPQEIKIYSPRVTQR